MRVWVTRTEPGASRLAGELARRGFTIFKAPVLSIEPICSSPPSGRFDFVLFVSEHAVSCAADNDCRRADWRDSPTAAIGATAEAALRAQGARPCMSWQADAASVMKALASPPARTLIVKGEGGGDTLQRRLQAQGCIVAEWNVYRRVPKLRDIEGERIDAIVAASGDGLHAIARLWFAAPRDAGVLLLVPSARVAGLAADAGFENIVVTSGARSSAAADTLARLRNEQSNG